MGKLTDRQIQAFTYPKDKGHHADGDSLFLDVRDVNRAQADKNRNSPESLHVPGFFHAFRHEADWKKTVTAEKQRVADGLT